MNSAYDSNGRCVLTCRTQNHETYLECRDAQAFDAGWTNALMQLDVWIRGSRKEISKDVQALRQEIMAMINETHGKHLPITEDAIKALKRNV